MDLKRRGEVARLLLHKGEKVKSGVIAKNLQTNSHYALRAFPALKPQAMLRKNLAALWHVPQSCVHVLVITQSVQS